MINSIQTCPLINLSSDWSIVCILSSDWLIVCILSSDWSVICILSSDWLITWHIAGLASSPEFTSDQAGSTETEFLLQWRSKSFTPITQFRLEVRERDSSSWRWGHSDDDDDDDVMFSGATQWQLTRMEHITGLANSSSQTSAGPLSTRPGSAQRMQRWVITMITMMMMTVMIIIAGLE